MFKSTENISMPTTTINNENDQHLDYEQLVNTVHRLMDERERLWQENEYLKAKLNESLLIETINEIRTERDLLLKLLLNMSTTTTATTTHHNKEQQRWKQSNEQLSQHHHIEDNTGYSNDLLPPPPYQTFSTPAPVKLMNSNISSAKNVYVNQSNSRQNRSATVTRDVPIQHLHQHQTPISTINSELKQPRRYHRSKTNTEPLSQQQQQQQQQQPTAVYRVEGTRASLMNVDELSSVFAHVKRSHPNKKIVVYKTTTTPQTQDFNQLVDEMCIKHGVELKHSQNSPFHYYRSQSLQDLTSPSTTNLLPPSSRRDFDFNFQPIEQQEQIRANYTRKWLQTTN